MGKCINYTVLVVSILVGLGVYQFGLLVPLNPIRGSFPEIPILYTGVSGSYTKSYMSISNIVDYLKTNHGIDTSKLPTFGVYYDDPKTTEPKNCRSAVGIVIPSNFDTSIKLLDTFHYGKIDSARDVVVYHYPYKSLLSIFGGIIRVYPAAAKHFTVNNIPMPSGGIIELYGFHGSNITYVFGVGDSTGIVKNSPKMDYQN